MSTLAIALKDEIRRLARKEIKIQTARTSRAVAQYRREIAKLKRQHREYEKKLATLGAKATKNRPVDDNDDANDGLRFSAKSVRAQRRRTGLSAAEYAKLIGVSPLTIYNWEHNKTRPRRGQFATLVALRGLGKREAHAKLLQAAATKNGSPRKRARRVPK